jgi:hypothetical protein
MPEQRVTSEILWQGALIFALIDALFVTFLVRRIEPEMFLQLKSLLAITSGIFWFLMWILMSTFFWEPVYHYVFPAWARWLIPPLYGLLFALVALLFWWLSFRLPGLPVLNFCILGGLWGTVTHLWGITRGLIDKPPMLQGASPAAVLVMPIFEFMFYWSVILTVSSLLYRRRNRTRGSMQ